MLKSKITIKVDEIKFEQIKSYYSSFLKENDGQYVSFFAVKDDIKITGFASKKINKSIIFEGDNALKEAQMWGNIAQKDTPRKLEAKWLDYEDQIGSDEVGVGDFLLPVIVVASFVSYKDMHFLKEIGVNDSKKLTDKKIMEIATELLKRVRYSKLTLPIDKYNEVVSSGENLNSIKAKMHNRALLNVHKEFIDVTHIYVDQFVSEKKYYDYLNDNNEEKVTGIAFKTKGESYFPSVAVSSIIARYSFLLEKKHLEEKYQMEFPFGASKKVLDFAKLFIKKYGIEEFSHIAKHHFVNYKEIISQ